MKASCENGAILLFLAVFAIVLIIFTALAIDVGIAASAKAHRQYTAEMAASGALETYMATAPVCGGGACDYTNAFDAALARAKGIIGDNAPLMAASSYLEDSLVSKPQNEIGAQAHSINGAIYGGNWFATQPKGDCGTYVEVDSDTSCPCPGGVWNGPCLSKNDDKTKRANALRIDLKLRDDSKLKTLFASAIGQNTLGFSVSATATIVPRHSLFMVDVSGSVQGDNHRLDLNNFAASGDYAYKATNQTGCENKSGLLVSWPDQVDQHFFDALGTTRGADTSQLTHYKDDYGGAGNGNCLSITTERSVTQQIGYADYGYADSLSSSSSPEWYLLDKYARPQPLTDILDGIHTVMNILESRSVPGDAFGIIGFDDDVLEERCLNYVHFSNMDRRRVDLVEPKSSNVFFKQFLDATDVSDINNKATKYLFPRRRGRFYLSGGPNISPFSYLTRALQVAMLSLRRELIYDSETNRSSVSQSIALFTDGFGNCASWLNPTCSITDYRYFWDAMEGAYVQMNELRKDGVIVHVFLFGNRGAPHTLLRRSRERKACMTDAEARRYSTPYVNYGDNWGNTNFTESMSDPDVHFFGPNRLYENASRYTGGMWVPVRPCCKTVDGVCKDITAKLDVICANVGTKGALVTDTTAVRNELDNGSYFDSSSRLMCDPTDRTQNEQIKFAISEIMRNNPIILTE